jgi:uncharacterized protein (TIGR03437 family)
MPKLRSLLYLLVCASGLAQAQPFISPKGVLNAGSYASPGLPGGSIARGSVFSIFGLRLGPDTGVQASSFPLGATLAGVSIKVTQGNTSVDALPVYVAFTQINAIMPSNAPLGMVSVQVTYNNAKGNPAPVQVVNSSVGIYAINSGGFGPGVLQNFIASDQQPINAPAVSATPGQAIILWGTGLGPVSADNVAPTPGDLPTTVEIYVGGKLAPKLYSGRSPCCSGTDQIVFQVPADAPLGCYVPVYIRTGGTSTGATTSNVVTMAISQSGSACSDAAPISQALRQGGKFGVAAFARMNAKIYGDAPTEYSSDVALVSMRQERANPFAFNPLLTLPPAGTCTAYNVAGDVLGGADLAGIAPTGPLLDYGTTLSLTGPRGSRPIPRFTGSGISLVGLGGIVPNVPKLNRPMLDAGNYILTGSGGPDVGSFRADFGVPAGLTWTNRDQIQTIDRTQPLTLNWSNAPSNNTVFVWGASVDRSTNASAVFECIAQPGSSSLTVPAQILASLPASRASLQQSRGTLHVGNFPTSLQAFTAPGLDAGITLPIFMTGRRVTFK